MNALQDLALGTFHDWLDLPPWPAPASIRLQQEADEYQREQIATAQSEAAHEAALKEHSK
jgi:hypothetical protein